MQPWASLGSGYGNVAVRAPMPIGKVPQGDPLAMIADALMRGMSSGSAPMPEEPDPEAEKAMARLLGLLPAEAKPAEWQALGLR